MNDLYKQCHKAFKAEEHEWLQNKFIYVTVNSTIQRLNELVLGGPLKEVYGFGEKVDNDPSRIPTFERLTTPVQWSLEHSNSSLVPYDVTNSSGVVKTNFLSHCAVELTIPGLGTRMGSGADSSFDPDNAAKSAQAYALRKAANQFGVAHYLLMNPEKESDLVKHLLASDIDDEVAMKTGVVMLMEIRKLDVSTANLQAEFKVSLEDIKGDVEIFKKILQQENRI